MFNKVLKEELKVPANNDSLKELRDFVAKVGKKYRFSDKVINAFKLAIDEASTNIIRHSYRDRTGYITIRAVIRNESLTICLIDQGRYFDPTAVKDPDLKRYVAIGKKGGLGIFMIRKLVDEIIYHKTEEGNELRLTKKKDIERKRKFLIPAVPGSMRTKYYAYSAVVVSLVVMFIYIYNFINTDNEILAVEFENMVAISDQLATIGVDGITNGYSDARISDEIADLLTPYANSVAFGAITDRNQMVLGSNNSWAIPTYDIFKAGDPQKTFQTGIQLVTKEWTDQTGTVNERDYFLVHKPVVSSTGEQIGKAYLYARSDPIFGSISQQRISDFKLAILILLSANVGVGLLIFLIFVPLQKLSNWIRDMGQEDIRDKIDIDTSNEIGKIAQAFGDITDKFRESQKSLAEQERIQQEMHLAKEIQQTLLPAEFPVIKGYEIASHYESAKEVGGDYYDFVEVDRDRVGVVVADVSGKGVPGSLVMTMIRTALRTEAKGIGSASEVLSKVNNFVLGDIRKGMFVTLFYTILDSRKRRVTFASAGHNPMILYRASTKKTYYLNPKGFPIGISLNEGNLFSRSIEDDTIQLNKGDIIICYTDGITEAMNSSRELFGEERLLEVIRQYGHLRAKNFVEKLKEELVAFTEGQVQYDDITFVVIKEKMSPEESDFERAKEVYYDILNGKSKTDACTKHGMPISTFSMKYQEKLEKVGVDKFKNEFETTSIEARHISIEEQTKIYDIIRQHPEWGAKRISTQLNTEEYGFTEISENQIYNELVRKRLNTRALREAYVSRSINKKRMKPPGTPMLTLDGQIVLDDHLGPKLHAPLLDEPETRSDEKPSVEDDMPSIEIQRKQIIEKKLIDEKEGADLVLSDLVDLLDKGKEQKDRTEDTSDDEDRDLDQSLTLVEESDYHVEDMDERSNGDDDKKPGEESPLSADKASGDGKKKKTPAQLLNDLSVEVEDDAFADDFEQIISEESLEIAKDAVDGQIIEQDETKPIKDAHETPHKTGQKPAEKIKSKEVNELFEDLSVNLKEVSEESIYNSEDYTDNKTGEFFELMFSDEINLEKELVSAEKPSLESRQTSRDGKIDYQQRLLVVGGHFYLQKKYDNAIQIFLRILSKQPNNIEAQYNLGNSYFRLKQYDEAQKAYEIVYELDPTFLDALENLGVIFANKKEFKDAIKVWKKILEFDPGREDIKRNIEKALRIGKKTNQL